MAGNTDEYFVIETINNLRWMSLNHSSYSGARWEIRANIGSAANPVNFVIAPANGLANVNNPMLLGTNTAFVGVINGNNHTIYLGINDSNANGVIGFIGHLGNGNVSNITFQGSVQGRNIVGGVVGWMANGMVANNDTTGVTFPVPDDANPNRIFGRVVGVHMGGTVYPTADTNIGYPQSSTGASLALDDILLPEFDDDDEYIYQDGEPESAENENCDAAIKEPDDEPLKDEPEPDEDDPVFKAPDDDEPDDPVFKEPEEDDEPEDNEPKDDADNAEKEHLISIETYNKICSLLYGRKYR